MQFLYTQTKHHPKILHLSISTPGTTNSDKRLLLGPRTQASASGVLLQLGHPLPEVAASRPGAAAEHLPQLGHAPVDLFAQLFGQHFPRVAGADVEVAHPAAPVQLRVRHVDRGEVAQPGVLLLRGVLLQLVLLQLVLLRGGGLVEVDGDGAVGVFGGGGGLLGVHLDGVLVEFSRFGAQGGLLGTHLLRHLLAREKQLLLLKVFWGNTPFSRSRKQLLATSENK